LTFLPYVVGNPDLQPPNCAGPTNTVNPWYIPYTVPFRTE